MLPDCIRQQGDVQSVTFLLARIPLRYGEVVNAIFFLRGYIWQGYHFFVILFLHADVTFFKGGDTALCLGHQIHLDSMCLLLLQADNFLVTQRQAPLVVFLKEKSIWESSSVSLSVKI